MNRTPFRTGIWLCCLGGVLLIGQACTSLQPLPRFRSSSSSFAPDQLPQSQRNANDLIDPAIVGAYSALKESNSPGRIMGLSLVENGNTVINQSASPSTAADKVGLEIEVIEEDLTSEEEYSMEEPPIDEAVIQKVISHNFAAIPSELVDANPAVNRVDMMKEIVNLLGVRYRYGGVDAVKGLDCSAFVGTVYSRALGVRLPRSSGSQFGLGKRIKKEQLKVGDLVFFKTRRRRAPVSHVGIYVGENLFAHASSKHGVIISTLEGGFYNRTYVGARRVVETEFTDARLQR